MSYKSRSLLVEVDPSDILYTIKDTIVLSEAKPKTVKIASSKESTLLFSAFPVEFPGFVYDPTKSFTTLTPAV